MNSWLDDLLGNIIQWAGVNQPQRKIINFISGVSIADNPGNDSTDIVFTGPSSQEFLAASVVIDCSLSTAQNLYTVPAGMRFVISAIVARNPTATITTWSPNSGYDSPPTNVGGLSIPEGTNTYAFTTMNGATEIGNSGDVLKVKAGATQASTSITIDVFGYFF